MNKKKLIRFQASRLEEGVSLRCYLSAPLFLKHGPEDEDVPVRIYRQEQPDFVFGHDQEEFSDGLVPTESDLIFEGTIRETNRRKLEYLDRTVEIGRTYCYWIAHGTDAFFSGPKAIKVRDPRVWWPVEQVRLRLEALAAEYPSEAALIPCGSSARGTPLLGIRAGNPERAIALVGAVHPGEAGPELIVPIVERLLKENRELLSRVGIVALPSVNVDERERMTLGHPPYLRLNSNGVDLNRNFPAGWDAISYAYGLDSSDPDSPTYRGKSPASEPEVQAVMRFLETTRPLAVFSFHCLAGICSPVFLTSQFAADDEVFLAKAKAFAEPYKEGFYGGSREHAREISFGCTGGSLPHWLYQCSAIPAFDLEWDGQEESRPCLTDETTAELIARYAELHYLGVRKVLEAS